MSLSSRTTRRVALGSLFALTIAMTSLTVFADDKADAAKGKKEVTLGLEGYCPVCIVDGKKWVRGNPQHEVTYDGKTYRFPGEKQKQKFLANPTKYVPALGGDCTVCYAKVGKRVRGNIRHAVFHHERLYLFPSEKEKAAFLGSPKEFAEVDLALDGKCAVCRTNAGKDVPGKPEFKAIHQGLRYQFPSAKERDVFLADPAKYAVKSASDAQASLKKNTEKVIIDGEVQYAVQYEAELVRDQKDAYRREELDQATEELPALPIKSKAKKKKQSKSGSRESIKIKRIQNRVSKRTEKVAQSRLKLAKQLLGQKQNAKAKKWLNRILEKYPATKSAKEAKQILKQSLGSFSSDEM